MFGKIFPILLLVIAISADAQTEKTIKKGIVNGAAISLPKPDYPQAAKDFCADGMVEIEVEIDESGSVTSAKAAKGDSLLYDSAVEAAKKAKFRFVSPVKFSGIIVYNFVSEKKCIDAGIVNKRALSIPKPLVGNINLGITEEKTVKVQIIIDLLTGEVTRAKAFTGHPLIRAVCEASARQAKFRPFYHGAGILVKAIIAYKFKRDGKIEF